MTEYLYQTDSYLRSFDAVVQVVDAENHALILDRSAFYPAGGGQPGDLGTLTIAGVAFPLVKIKKAGPDVLHFLDPESVLPAVGCQVHGEVEWERR